jgi:Domain of unknown function (DUF1707)/Domain of unknown function (DUF4333)
MQPGGADGDSMRANDVDRANVCAILDNAYADGELDADEHRQRCAAVMSGKTRGQLLAMISDLQARPPAFSPLPAIAVSGTSNRKWVVGATVGVGLAVVVLGVLTAWFFGPNSSPTVPAMAPTARVAAPTPPVAAPTDTRSSDTTGTFLPLADVVATVSGDFQDQIGHPPQHVNCPGDLAGQVGAFERCSILDNGKRYTADVTVTAVNGNRITTRDSIDEEGSPPPSQP